MYITNNLIDFLNDSKLISNSTIVLTDLEKIVFVATDGKTDYLNKVFSDDLKRILSLYIFDASCSDFMNFSLDTVVPLTDEDDASKYKSQIILPILHSNIVVGLLIFISDDREYLESNLKYAKTAKHFVEIFSTEEYL